MCLISDTSGVKSCLWTRVWVGHFPFSTLAFQCCSYGRLNLVARTADLNRVK